MGSQPSVFLCLFKRLQGGMAGLRAVAGIVAGAALALAQPALAQTVNRYTNSTDSAAGGINETATPCTTTGSLKRTFSVGTSFTVTDVNIGVLAAHSYRGDMQMFLTSPSGTRVQLTAGSGSIGATNFNALFDDSAADVIANYTTNATSTATTAVPPYASSYRPSAALSAFNGQNAAGTWTLELCDQYNSDSGTFYQADLYLAAATTNYADLSLAMSVSNSAPTSGASIAYTLTVTNASGSPQTASGITVSSLLPAGVSYTSYSGTGSYSSATGIWTVGTLAPGQSATLVINAMVTASSGAPITHTAEISASSQSDLDSTPGNGASGEDDLASASLTVAGTRVAGSPPVLTCAAGTSLFDWDTIAWTAGSTSNSYTLSGIGSVAFSITNQGAFLNNATYGGQSPALQSTVTGGLAVAQKSLAQLIDLVNRTDSATTTITLGTAVPGLQFQIFDVDYASGQFADRVTVTGSLAGTTVLPTLTNGTANYVIGNSAYGDALSSDTQANGNLTVTFTSPVDTITINYGDHALAPSAPGQQAIEIFDITFCKPVASIGVTKVSSVISDPVNGSTNPKAIPGALIEYCILVTNTGSATVTGLTASDTLPPQFLYAAGTMTSGANCAAATTAEDDNNTGGDESDPFGASISGTVLTATAGSLSAGSSFALKFRGTVK